MGNCKINTNTKKWQITELNIQLNEIVFSCKIYSSYFCFIYKFNLFSNIYYNGYKNIYTVIYIYIYYIYYLMIIFIMFKKGSNIA